MRDKWNDCYEGEFRKESPAEFKKTFCERCLNLECTNSRGVGTAWSRRMATQADRLLNNPTFADRNDPAFQAIRGMNFEDRLKEALAIDVAERKGDWSVPTEREVGAAAAELVGVKAPHFFLMSEGPSKPEKPPSTGVTVEAPLPESVPRKQRGQWKIRGSADSVYQVTLWEDGAVECTCPSRENPCKHARLVLDKLAKLPADAPTVTPEKPPEPPAPPTRPPLHPAENAPPVLVIRAPNTNIPDQGLMIGGGPPPETPASTPPIDPWAPPPKPVSILPVGGRVRFGTGMKS